MFCSLLSQPTSFRCFITRTSAATSMCDPLTLSGLDLWILDSFAIVRPIFFSKSLSRGISLTTW